MSCHLPPGNSCADSCLGCLGPSCKHFGFGWLSVKPLSDRDKLQRNTNKLRLRTKIALVIINSCRMVWCILFPLAAEVCLLWRLLCFLWRRTCPESKPSVWGPSFWMTSGTDKAVDFMSGPSSFSENVKSSDVALCSASGETSVLNKNFRCATFSATLSSCVLNFWYSSTRGIRRDQCSRDFGNEDDAPVEEGKNRGLMGISSWR